MIWVIGSKGMLGRQIVQKLTASQIEHLTSDREVDITNPSALKQFTRNKRINWVINCSAYTAVDRAESEPDAARAINVLGVENIAKTVKSIDATLIHFSTDYVFDGNKPEAYDEADVPSPVSVYGETKLEGEIMIKHWLHKFFIIRISWLYGLYGGNFVKTMLRLMSQQEEINVINDQFGSPTYADTLAENIISLVKDNSEQYGVYHYSDQGVISWYDFAVAIMNEARKINKSLKAKSVNPISTNQYHTAAQRPLNSDFNKQKIKSKLNFTVNNWQDNLNSFLANRDT